MSLPKAYEPGNYETDIYSLWEKSGVFRPKEQGAKGYFSIVAPPPNANANLHIGYGLVMAIEDTIVRYQRMQGRATLFIPGADHAGFETWVVYEKKLNQAGKSRFDFTREDLYKQVWDFVEENKQNFQSQLRSLGASFDWDHFTYTLDQKVVDRAYATFKKMWDEQLIYRGKRIVNYCTFHGTSFSDIEVVHEEETSQLWQIAYPLADGSGEVVIATTRPETKLGQSALMVNPNDKRYSRLIGQEVLQPLVPNKPIKIIGDEHVDMDFGTGVVTVTPAHDPNDFEVAQTHNLPLIELITTEGKMSQNVPKQFRGLTVLEAREKVAEELAKHGSLRGVESYTHTVGKCYKCGTVIEPLALEQWFINMEPLAKRAIQSLEDKKIKFYPDNKRPQLVRYLEGLRDWNISRQIAWGIPIPAFQNTADPTDWIFDTRVDQGTIEIDGKSYRRDQDVFDTWFSSGHWPIVTLDYPDSEDFKRYYPTSLMETGGEILHQWVARMIMLGLYITDDIPFKDVYINGYVMAEGGAKMSKSLGNVIDPQDVINEFGCDALRMGLLAGRSAAVNRGYDRRRVEEARNFCNKLWNVARYIESVEPQPDTATENTPVDHWILNKLSIVQIRVSKLLEDYRLSEAYEALYHFVWDDFADWYIEASKVQPNSTVLMQALKGTLRLTHPFAPFVTETIWQKMELGKGDLLAAELWSDTDSSDSVAASKFEDVMSIVSEIRRITAALGINKPKLYYQEAPELRAQTDLIVRLAGLGAMQTAPEDYSGGIKLISTKYSCWLDIDPQTTSKYLVKLDTQLNSTKSLIETLENRLNNEAYIGKAPADLVEASRQQLESERQSLAALSAELSSYEKALEL